MANRILRNLCNRVQLGFIALRVMTQKRKSGGRGTALQPIGLDSEYYPRCYLKPPLETGMGPLFINPGSKLLEIAALGVGNTRTLRRQWYAYAPAEGHARHERFSPVCFSFFLVLSSPRSPFLFFTFLKNFCFLHTMEETRNSFTAWYKLLVFTWVTPFCWVKPSSPVIASASIVFNINEHRGHGSLALRRPVLFSVRKTA